MKQVVSGQLTTQQRAAIAGAVACVVSHDQQENTCLWISFEAIYCRNNSDAVWELVLKILYGESARSSSYWIWAVQQVDEVLDMYIAHCKCNKGVMFEPISIEDACLYLAEHSM